MPCGEAAGKRAEGPEGPTQMTGRTGCDRIVVFDGHTRQAGQLLPVVVEEASPVTLFGRVVTREAIAS